jgi:5-(carboxyamino)imidazole ribonucleotide mutase
MNASPTVGVVMGSKSDYEVLLPCIDLLREFAIPHEARIVSAHRTPDWLLPGMLAAKTILPVLAVPVPSTCLQGIDSLLSIVQMPKGVPVATLAIGKPGAANAALLAIAILAGHDAELGNRLRAWREARSQEVLETELPS